MGFSSKVRTEDSFRVGAYVFDIDLIHYGGWVGKKTIDELGFEIRISELPGGIIISNFKDWDMPYFTLEQIENGTLDKLNENNYTKVYLPYIQPCVAEYKKAVRLFRAKQKMKRAIE